jgi:hypothetical protein
MFARTRAALLWLLFMPWTELTYQLVLTEPEPASSGTAPGSGPPAIVETEPERQVASFALLERPVAEPRAGCAYGIYAGSPAPLLARLADLGRAGWIVVVLEAALLMAGLYRYRADIPALSWGVFALLVLAACLAINKLLTALSPAVTPDAFELGCAVGLMQALLVDLQPAWSSVAVAAGGLAAGAAAVLLGSGNRMTTQEYGSC